MKKIIDYGIVIIIAIIVAAILIPAASVIINSGLVQDLTTEIQS